MRSYAVFALLIALKGLTKLFFKHGVEWVGEVPADRWRGVRLVAILNHTSLFEPVFVGCVPPAFLWQVARHGVVPVAQKTLDRPLVGLLFRVVARHVVPLTRRRDESWEQVLAKVEDPEALLVILPEGRMKRVTGLDADGKPMTVRGGVADVLRLRPGGRMLLAYSAGLHHVHAPGDRFPRLFRTVRLRLEAVDISAYCARLLASGGADGFTAAVIEDLTRRRDRYCGWRSTARDGAG